MPSKMRPGKAIWIVAAAVIVASLLLITLFVTQNSPKSQESIVLPAAPVDSPGDFAQNDDLFTSSGDDFIIVTNENVATVLRTLSRPMAYHQSYTVSVGAEEGRHTKTVELWINGSLMHAEVTDGEQTQSVVTDGNSLYLWYEESDQYITLNLPKGMTAEDVLGVPNFDAYLDIDQSSISESDYLLTEEHQIPCIYVCVQETDDVLARYWVNLENGLLYQADVTEKGKPLYSILQTGFDLLAIEDESFSNRFILPDGTVPFTAETGMQQP